MAYVRKAKLSQDWYTQRDSLLVQGFPGGWETQIITELDPTGTYRQILDPGMGVIGWASLDEDGGGICLVGECYTAIVASEEAWVNPTDETDVIYHTQPKTSEYAALSATGIVNATFDKESIENFWATPPGYEVGRKLAMIYWAILLSPEEPSEVKRCGAKFRRVGFAQILRKEWQRPDDWKLIALV